MGGQLRHLHLRQRSVAVQIEAGVERHEVFIPALILRQKHQGGRSARLFSRRCGVIGHIHLAADDWLNTRLGRRFRKLQGAKHIVGIRHRNGRHAHRHRQIGQFLEPNGPLEQ